MILIYIKVYLYYSKSLSLSDSFYGFQCVEWNGHDHDRRVMYTPLSLLIDTIYCLELTNYIRFITCIYV